MGENTVDDFTRNQTLVLTNQKDFIKTVLEGMSKLEELNKRLKGEVSYLDLECCEGKGLNPPKILFSLKNHNTEIDRASLCINQSKALCIIFFSSYNSSI
jgi:hypothetical protein